MKKSVIIFIYLILSLCSKIGFCQNETSTSRFIHISGKNDKLNLKGIILKSKDSLGNIIWHSELIKPIDKDSLGYFFKIDVPNAYVASKLIMNELYSPGVCCASGLPDDPIFDQREVVDTLTKIKLLIRSNPEGAQTFLIPNRIWIKNLQGADLHRKADFLSYFQVNTSKTNTFALVDETVFVVLYKFNNIFKKIIYKTQPAHIAKEQIASIDL